MPPTDDQTGERMAYDKDEAAKQAERRRALLEADRKKAEAAARKAEKEAREKQRRTRASDPVRTL